MGFHRTVRVKARYERVVQKEGTVQDTIVFHLGRYEKQRSFWCRILEFEKIGKDDAAVKTMHESTADRRYHSDATWRSLVERVFHIAGHVHLVSECWVISVARKKRK